MNQIFSIKRFLHYTRFCLTYNLGLILMCVSLMALSALCSLTGAHKYVVFVYMAMISILFCMFLPMYSKYANAYSGCKTIEFLVPASLLEKYVVKNALAVLMLLIPFCIHAVACASGFNGITHYFADGFELGTIVYGLFLVWLLPAVWRLITWGATFILHDTYNEPQLFFGIIFMFCFMNWVSYDSVSQYSVTKSAIFFAVAITLLIIDYFIYKKTDTL